MAHTITVAGQHADLRRAFPFTTEDYDELARRDVPLQAIVDGLTMIQWGTVVRFVFEKAGVRVANGHLLELTDEELRPVFRAIVHSEIFFAMSPIDLEAED